MKINLKKPLAFFDLETTGTNTIEDRIVEISIIKLMPNQEQKTYSKRINPQITIPKEASLVHGIYNEDVKDCPSFKMVSKEIFKFLEGCDLAGFNIIKFDIPLLIEEFLRCGIDFRIDKSNIIDVQKIFHLMEKRTLTAAYKFYCNKELKNAHSSMADTSATLEVLNSQIKRYEGKSVMDINGNQISTIENDMLSLHKISFQKHMIDLANRMIYNKEGIPIFNFGKYKGEPIKKVLLKDPSYYSWLIKSSFPQDTKRKLTKFKLEMSEMKSN
ncbi:MAG: 3'-5' exonuclease [Bacteroidetes bacterium]|nr:3'-5' exonuclease [Bacteroidota bacterium]